MKLRTVIILWLIASVLGVAAYFVKFHSSDTQTTHTQLSPGDKFLPNLPIRDLRRVTLKQGTDTTTLTRGEHNLWTIDERNAYPANHELLRNLLGALASIQVTQGYPCTSKNYGRFGVASESDEPSDLGLRVSMMTAGDKVAAEVFLGKYNGATRESMGRFLRISGDDSGVYVGGETFPGIYADPPAWLEPAFLKVSHIRSIHVAAPDAPEFSPWEIAKASPAPKDQFKLTDITEKEIMQITSTGPFRNLFSFTTFKDVLTAKEVKATSHPDKKLKRIAVIKTFDGLTYTVTFWPQVPAKKTEPTSELTPPAPEEPAYLMTVRISADLPTTRPTNADESPEAKKKNDEAFQNHLLSLKELIQQVHGFQTYTYQVSQSTIAPLLKSRGDFVIVRK